MEGDAADGGGLSQDLERVMDEDGQSGIAEGEGQSHSQGSSAPPMPDDTSHPKVLQILITFLCKSAPNHLHQGGCPAKLHFTSNTPH
jgi:hypothetical protein